MIRPATNGFKKGKDDVAELTEHKPKQQMIASDSLLVSSNYISLYANVSYPAPSSAQGSVCFSHPFLSLERFETPYLICSILSSFTNHLRLG